jgi:hypothetical protein
MSASGNGHGQNPEATVRANSMLVATKDFECEYDGKRVELKAGFDRVGGDHELAARFPQNFRPVERGQSGERSVVVHRMMDGASLRHPARTTQGANSRELPTPSERLTMTLEQELRIRREALAELDRRERERAAPDAAKTSWEDVARLMGTAQQETQDKADMDLYDALDGARAESLEQERRGLARWLDEQ